MKAGAASPAGEAQRTFVSRHTGDRCHWIACKDSGNGGDPRIRKLKSVLRHCFNPYSWDKSNFKRGDSTDFTHHSRLDDSWREAEPIKTVATLSLFRSFVKSGKMTQVVT